MSFVWSRKEGLSNKSPMAWEKVCQPKSNGGLNARQVVKWNKAALIKQVWVLALMKDILWVNWVHAYYIKSSYFMVCLFPKFISWMLRKIMDMRYVVMDWGGLSSIASPELLFISKAYYKLRIIQPVVLWRWLLLRNGATAKSQFIVWLLCHQRLATIDRLKRWGVVSSDQCCLCSKYSESHDHLFLYYEFTQRLRRKVMKVFSSDDVAVTLEPEVSGVANISRTKI